jgi:hypothetical protein
VRPGLELAALRWIYGKSVATLLPDNIESRFQALVDEIRTFRGDVLAEPDELPTLEKPCQDTPERVYSMASWTEVMPTDGTHLEVVQGITSATDQITSPEIDDAAAMRKALLAGEQQAAKLKDRAYEQMTEPADLDFT